ncbi:zeta toxin family protein [Neisseria sp. HMSC065D04]|uniref:zeta toxin family protein n=1 Tax=Neisseria sp. HMSC065D04 TaxID=1739542 RepID=UPI001FED362B|nr:zeta toxin family protein [Neisseria sp. HMSC065D04]
MMSDRREALIFRHLWNDLISEQQVSPVKSPKGFVLGGQPGAGKSNLVGIIRQELNRNVLIINGDEFRRYHPNFDGIQEQYGIDSPKHTAAFSGHMTERVIEKALREGYNISVEGTFRTTETPMRTLEKMREHGYQTAVYIQTAPLEVSWQSTLERYHAMELLGETPRATPKEHHDLVVKLLPQNADAVFLSGKADEFKVYSREGLIFDSRVQFQEMPSVAIDHELHRNTRRLRILETNLQEHAHLLSNTQKQVIAGAEELIAKLPPSFQIQAKINLYDNQLQQLDKHPKQDRDLDIER